MFPFVVIKGTRGGDVTYDESYKNTLRIWGLAVVNDSDVWEAKVIMDFEEDHCGMMRMRSPRINLVGSRRDNGWDLQPAVGERVISNSCCLNKDRSALLANRYSEEQYFHPALPRVTTERPVHEYLSESLWGAIAAVCWNNMRNGLIATDVTCGPITDLMEYLPAAQVVPQLERYTSESYVPPHFRCLETATGYTYNDSTELSRNWNTGNRMVVHTVSFGATDCYEDYCDECGAGEASSAAYCPACDADRRQNFRRIRFPFGQQLARNQEVWKAYYNLSPNHFWRNG